MSKPKLDRALALAAALTATIGAASAAEMKYPNWKGQWDAINPRLGGQGVKFDPNKAFGPAQQCAVDVGVPEDPR